MKGIENNLQSIRGKVHQVAIKDVFSMDEGLFYRLH